jgi:hypothetical protein
MLKRSARWRASPPLLAQEARHRLVTEALRRAAEAHDYASAGKRNAAIGTLSGMDVLLEGALALYRSALSIHWAW